MTFFPLLFINLLFFGKSAQAFSHQKSIKDQFTVGPVFSYTAYNLTQKSNGAEAKLYSNLNYGLSLSWDHRWTPSWSDQIKFTTIYNDIGMDSDSVLTNNKVLLSRLEWTTSYRFKGLNQIKSIFGFYENIYSDSLSHEKVEVARFIIPEWMIAYQRYLTTKDKNFLRILIGAGPVYSLQASSLGYKTLLTIGFGVAKKEFILSYTRKEYDSNFLQNSSDELLFSFLFKF
ncbi:MAG: hypothetical protein KBD76_11215 [Bacteriovorax sp.]|nr:hypothetical protein [Bacteriovorax sp.]